MTRPALLSGVPTDRAAAITRLAVRDTLPTDAELAALLDCLADRSKLVQRRAAESLATLQRRGLAVAASLHTRIAAGELHARWGVVYALSLLGPLPLSTVPTLMDVVGADDGDLRWAAADLLKAIAATDRAAVTEPLIASVRAGGPGAKMALYCLRDLAVIEALAVAEAALSGCAID